MNLELPDGRALAYDDVGDPAGTPVVYLHGTPDCRLARHPDDGLTGELGVRLVAVDRPGCGRSDPDPQATTASVALDVAAIADYLGFGQYAVLGWSLGGLFALGCAAASPAVSAVAIAAPVVPLDQPDPIDVETARAAAEFVVPAPCPPDVAREFVLEGGPARRRELDAVPGALEQLSGSVVECVAHHGLAGVAGDLELQSHGLSVDLAAVRCPVVLWSGSDDDRSPPEVGAQLAGRLPSATHRVVAGAGHAILLTHWREVLTDLAARARDR